MVEYINEIKRQFRDVYGFEPTGGTADSPIFTNIPDGVYPMEIEGQVKDVIIKNNNIHISNI